MSRSVKQDYPPKRPWEAGEKAYAAKLDNGHVYLNQEALDHLGLDTVSKINGSDIVEVTVVEG